MTYTDEQIESMAKGEDVMGVAAPVEEAQEEEHEEVVEEEVEQVEEATDEPEEHEEEEQPKQRRKPSDRIRELAAQKNEAKAALEAKEREMISLQVRLDQQQQALQRLTSQLAGNVPQDAEEEVLDDVLDRRVTGEIKALKDEIAETRVSSEYTLGRASVADFDNAESYLIAAKANQVMHEMAFNGITVTQEQAIQEANKMLQSRYKQIAASNKNAGAVAKYIYNTAIQNGYRTESLDKAKPSVNMKAVQRARDEAGAPAIRKESVASGGGSWSTQMEQWSKDDNLKGVNVKSLIGA